MLFNYSLAENLLYGKLKASNEDIRRSANVADALEFIESTEISSAFSGDVRELKKSMQSVIYMKEIIADVGQVKYDEMVR